MQDVVSMKAPRKVKHERDIKKKKNLRAAGLRRRVHAS